MTIGPLIWKQDKTNQPTKTNDEQIAYLVVCTIPNIIFVLVHHLPYNYKPILSMHLMYVLHLTKGWLPIEF